MGQGFIGGQISVPQPFKLGHGFVESILRNQRCLTDIPAASQMPFANMCRIISPFLKIPGYRWCLEVQKITHSSGSILLPRVYVGSNPPAGGIMTSDNRSPGR